MRKESIAGIVFAALISGAIKTALVAWALMLTVGVIHGEWLPMLPTLGFWSALLVGLMLTWIVTVFQFSTSSDD